MKYAVSTLLVLSLFFLGYQNTTAQERQTKPLVPKFLSQTMLSGSSANQQMATSYSKLKKDLFSPIVSRALDGTLEVYEPLNEVWNSQHLTRLTDAQIDRKFNLMDTVYIEQSTPPYDLEMVVIQDTFDVERIVSIRAFETWHLKESFKLEKDIIGYSLVSEIIDPTTGEIRSWEPLVTVKGELDQNTKKKIATVRYTQQIDNSSERNLWYHSFLDYSVRENLFSSIVEEAQNGSEQFYGEPNEASILDSVEINSRITLADTVYIENPEPPYIFERVITQDFLNWQSVTAIEFVQDVYVDDNLQIGYDLKWYAPVAKMRSLSNGEALAKKTLFWVKCF